MILLLLGCQPAGLDGWMVALEARLVDEDAAPVAGAEVRLSTPEGAWVADARTDADGWWTVAVAGDELTGHRLHAHHRADGFASLLAGFDVDLRAPVETELRAGPWNTWETTSRRLATLTLAEAAEQGTVDGEVVDATTGAAVPGVPLVVRAGWNAAAADPEVASATTDAQGRFALSLSPPGWYTVEVAPFDGWDGARFPVFASARGGAARGALSPALGPGQLRAALLWGTTPFDLDLHLVVSRPESEGGERYHVWSEAPAYPPRDPEDPDASLERSVTTGEGPETVAIHTGWPAGEITLGVMDADNLSDADSTALAASGALLQVWRGGEAPRWYTVAPGEVATWWSPVVIDIAAGVPYAVETYAVGLAPGDLDR